MLWRSFHMQGWLSQEGTIPFQAFARKDAQERLGTLSATMSWCGSLAEAHFSRGSLDCQIANCTDDPKIWRCVCHDLTGEVFGVSENGIPTLVPSTNEIVDQCLHAHRWCRMDESQKCFGSPVATTSAIRHSDTRCGGHIDLSFVNQSHSDLEKRYRQRPYILCNQLGKPTSRGYRSIPVAPHLWCGGGCFVATSSLGDSWRWQRKPACWGQIRSSASASKGGSELLGSAGFDGSRLETICAVAGTPNPTVSRICCPRSDGGFKTPLGAAGDKVHGGQNRSTVADGTSKIQAKTKALQARSSARELQTLQTLPTWQSEMVLQFVQWLSTWKDEESLCLVQWLSAWQAEAQLQWVHRLSTWQVEKELFPLRWLSTWQDEKALLYMQRLSAWKTETQLSHLQWMSPWPIKAKLRSL